MAEHVDRAARQVERVGAFVDEDRIRPLFDDGAQGAERAVEVHGRSGAHQPRRHLGDVFLAFRLDGVDPLRRRRRPLAAHAVEQRRDAGADVAHHRSDDLGIRVHLLRLDVDLDECLRRVAPGLALAVRQEPVEPGADQHDDVGLLQHRRACGAGTLRMRVGQKALGHAHRQKRYAALFDADCELVVGLRVGRAFPENHQGTLALFSRFSARVTASGAGIWAGAGSMTLTRDLAPASASIVCANSLAGKSR